MICNSLPVMRLKPGDKATIVQILGSDEGSLRKLAAFGILPGTEIEVLQIFPAYIFKVGYTQVALDLAAVKGIIVDNVVQKAQKI
ncbi:MAG TPA: FeoA family protein [Methylomusa anaerophila]|uniref:FeoA domain protein n=1 Tax=Methylomusa anaerophila TaxID=1930071 RepID=A0A348AQC7_9FIRM|nr:FeoA family protein [Methylomusa anaerophila]BBB93275.1 FeoA domain protein [Methylomusa anaerophila]HML86894.1 FeoA family protein [Methylomusa anaerophila]